MPYRATSHRHFLRSGTVSSGASLQASGSTRARSHSTALEAWKWSGRGGLSWQGALCHPGPAHHMLAPAYSPHVAGIGSGKSKDFRAQSGWAGIQVCHSTCGPWTKLFHCMCQVGANKLLGSRGGGQTLHGPLWGQEWMFPDPSLFFPPVREALQGAFVKMPG